MQFAEPRDRAQAYLILRHLYDGDVIDWPIGDGHPLRAIFEALEQQGYIARWDRTWPRHDRYRLTDRGIQAIEAVYQPAGADAIWSGLRANPGMSPADRRAQLQSQGLDPWLWALLHDPSSQWDAYGDSGSRYVDWLYEDQSPMRSRHQLLRTTSGVDDLEVGTDDDDAGAVAAAAAAAHVVDLDREAHHDGVNLERNDYDVS